MNGNDSTTQAIHQEHQRNEKRLDNLEKAVERVTSPPSSSSRSGGNGGGGSSGGRSASGNGTSVSPSQIAASLFNRSKPKAKSKSKGKSSGGNRSPANGKVVAPTATTNPSAGPSQLDALEKEIKRTKQDELNLVSSAAGIAPDGAVINETGDDEVLDLADQLLAQLDARKAEEEGGRGGVPLPATGTGSSVHTPVAQPVPVPGASPVNGASLGSDIGRTSSVAASVATSNSASTTDVARSMSTSPTPSTSTANTATSRSSLGSRIKKAFSPDSSATVSPTDSMSTADAGGGGGSGGIGGTFKNRHALRKEKKRQQEEAMRAEARAEVEAASANGARDPAQAEKEAFDRIKRQWGFEMYEIEPDGHCMYSAVADQLVARKSMKKVDYHETRRAAAEYMRAHVDDFLPFMPAEDEDGEGDGILSLEGYHKHCDNVERTGEWGGQAEILALSKHYKVPIYVFQANSPIVKVGMEEPYAKSSVPLMISYHRHQYGLGQHYNSLRALPPQHGIVMMSG